VIASWIVKLAERYKEDEGWGSLEAKQGWIDHPFKIEAELLDVLETWCRLCKKTTLREYQSILYSMFDVDVHTSTICRTFQRKNWVRRVTEYVHRNKFSTENVDCYSEYVGWIVEQDGGRVKFFDESHFDEKVFRGPRPVIKKMTRASTAKKLWCSRRRGYSIESVFALSLDSPGSGSSILFRHCWRKLRQLLLRRFLMQRNRK
jgi:transposase